jgi:hypothetical protein
MSLDQSQPNRQSNSHYDATIPMLIAHSPMNKTIETPTYNMVSIMVFPFHSASEAF